MKSPSSIGPLPAFLLRLALVLLAAICVTATAITLDRRPRTEDAVIRANVVGIAPQVSGAIVQIPVVDNQRVKRGDLLLELDDRTYRAEVAQAKARLETVKLDVSALAAEIGVARASLRERQARAAYATSFYERLKPLLDGKFISPDKAERAQSEAESALQLVAEAEASVLKAEGRLGEIEGRNVHIEEARAALQNAELRLAYCKVYAPCDGYVTNLQIAPGAFARAGEEIFSLVDDSVWFVLANFRETDLSRVRRGQRVRVYPMSTIHEPLEGWVQGVSRAVALNDNASISMPGGEGILSRVQPTFDFVQLAARFPVRIVLEPGHAHGLRVGGRASVVIDSVNKPDPARVSELEQGESKPFMAPVRE